MQQKETLTPQPNQLDIFRRKRKFTQKYVAHLLGHKDTSTWSDYERSKRLPSLVNALRLGIILRTPVEFLFHDLHDDLLRQIRAEEERLAQGFRNPVQQTLF
jgi:transcriptional regulator with XRE-family HTH domain